MTGHVYVSLAPTPTGPYPKSARMTPDTLRAIDRVLAGRKRRLAKVRPTFDPLAPTMGPWAVTR